MDRLDRIRRMGTRLNAEEEAEILALRREGKTIMRIATEMCRNYSTIKKRLKGVPRGR